MTKQCQGAIHRMIRYTCKGKLKYKASRWYALIYFFFTSFYSSHIYGQKCCEHCTEHFLFVFGQVQTQGHVRNIVL